MKGIALWLATVILYFVALNYVGEYLGDLSTGMMATLYVFIPLVGIPFVLMLKHRPLEIEEPVPLAQVLRDANFTISHEVTADGGLLLDDPRRQACLLIPRRPLKSFRLAPRVRPGPRIVPYAAVRDAKVVENWGYVVRSIEFRVTVWQRLQIRTRQIKFIALDVRLDDAAYPLHRIVFFDAPPGKPYDEAGMQRARERATYWKLMLDLVRDGVRLPEKETLGELREYVNEVAKKKDKGKKNLPRYSSRRYTKSDASGGSAEG